MTGRVLGGRVVLPEQVIPDGVVEIAGDTLGFVGDRRDWQGEQPAPVGTIVPGYVDVHCHGGGGHSVTTGSPEDVRRTAAHHLARGTTTMLASLVSAATDDITQAVAAIRQVVEEGGTVAGSHLEGPYLGRDHCGAHDPSQLAEPDVATVRSWLRTGGGSVRMLTIAPELPGAGDVAAVLAEAGVVVAAGHTDADVDTVAETLAGPAGLVTHLFNGMAPLHHREPGPVAAALTALARGTTRVELIADGVHLADATAAMVFALAPPDGVVLVSDAMAAAGMPDGDYRLGPLTVRVQDAIAWTTGEKRSIAGSTAHLADVVRRCVVHAGIDPVAVVRAASTTPATLLGLSDRGRLGTGLRADVLTLDGDWRVTAVLRGGEPVA
ncbi:N-acetylglucosamine-6-phosphate deacetylase [Nocardioides coralli]|uniref:N-acetylglucosamine-6-phosphate deacetylase n=1 Tax=Nocardioides coralli TaxID=2872154 RepID=UPI001CA4671E|nr:amidohydrolase family protein [Nocardioides coralli]QZY28590.1 amidohydrolase family protein [Nocardioides coralli]